MKLNDSTGSIDGPFFQETNRIYFFFITKGKATHLPYHKGTKPWDWSKDEILAVLDRVPIGVRLTVNMEYWDEWSKWEYLAFFSILKALRPDLELSLYGAHAYSWGIPRKEVIEVLLPVVGFFSPSLYAGRYFDIRAKGLQDLMDQTNEFPWNRHGVTCLVGMRAYGETPTRRSFANTVMACFNAGCFNISIWGNPAVDGKEVIEWMFYIVPELYSWWMRSNKLVTDGTSNHLGGI